MLSILFVIRDPYRIRTGVTGFADQYLNHSVKGSVREEGLEPSKVLPHYHLKVACLPVSPLTLTAILPDYCCICWNTIGIGYLQCSISSIHVYCFWLLTFILHNEGENNYHYSKPNESSSS